MIVCEIEKIALRGKFRIDADFLPVLVRPGYCEQYKSAGKAGRGFGVCAATMGKMGDRQRY